MGAAADTKTCAGINAGAPYCKAVRNLHKHHLSSAKVIRNKLYTQVFPQPHVHGCFWSPSEWELAWKFCFMLLKIGGSVHWPVVECMALSAVRCFSAAKPDRRQGTHTRERKLREIKNSCSVPPPPIGGTNASHQRSPALSGMRTGRWAPRAMCAQRVQCVQC